MDILQQVEDLREFINGPRMSYMLRKSMKNWNQICSSLDVIEDTDEAIRAYDSTPTNRQALREDIGKRYLALYGVLQAMFLQQDAVLNLCDALSIPTKLNDYDRLVEIREFRNSSIGHPTKREKKKKISHHFLSRISMNHPHDILLLSIFPNGITESMRIDINELIADQRKNIQLIITNVIATLRQRVEEHRIKFMNHKFADAFPSFLGYAFEKLQEAFRSPERSIAGSWCIEPIEKAMADFRSALQRQDMDVETFDHIELIYDELTYPLRELRSYLESEQSDIQNVDSARIVAFYIKSKIDELERFAKELDGYHDAN